MDFKSVIGNGLEELENENTQTKENENDKEMKSGIIVESTGLGEEIGNEIKNCSNWKTLTKLIQKRRVWSARGQNQKNKIQMFTRKTRFIGVFQHKIKNLFQVRFRPPGHQKSIDGGIYDDIFKAAKACDLLKTQLYHDPRLNFPSQIPSHLQIPKASREYVAKKKKKNKENKKNKVATQTYNGVCQTRSGSYYGQIYHLGKRHTTRTYKKKLHAVQAANWKCQQLGKELINPSVSCVDHDKTESAEIQSDVTILEVFKSLEKGPANRESVIDLISSSEDEECENIIDLLFKSLPPRFEEYRNIFIKEMLDLEDIHFITPNVLMEWGIVDQLDANKIFRILQRRNINKNIH